MTEATNFEYFNLADVDPTFKPVDKGVYTLELMKISGRMVEIKNGKMAGSTVPVVKLALQIVNHDTFSGRRIYEDLWLSNAFGAKSLRRFVDAVGVMQEPGEPILAFVERLATLAPAPRVKVYVDIKEDGKDFDGNPAAVNVVKWNNVQPA